LIRVIAMEVPPMNRRQMARVSLSGSWIAINRSGFASGPNPNWA
jgi:hypothetical protein